jgi:hypothetical protein
MRFRGLVFLFLIVAALPLLAQNMIVGSNMEDENAWDVVYYNAEFMPEFQFNYTDASIDVSPNRGGALRVILEDASTGGQLLIYQRVKCTAGMEYKASALIKVLDYGAPEGVTGQWFQFYVAVDEPDPAASDFNPSGAKMFNMSSWDGDMNAEWEFMNGYWESVKMTNEIETAPYWICPGTEGETVDVTVGVKFGSSPVEGAWFDLIVDDVSFYEVESANEVAAGDMSDENAWEIQWYNADFQPEYEFTTAPEDGPAYLRGDVLHLTLDEQAGGQLLFYQRLPLTAGETYRASGAIHVTDYYSDFEPVSQGPWYQMYVTTEEPPETGDFNPGGAKMFDISAWDIGCDMMDFEQFQGYWEQVRCLSEQEAAPYFTVPGEAGTSVEVTVGIKFGLWAPEPASWEVWVDDIQFFYEGDGTGVGVEFEADPAIPGDFVLGQNYPNPFNPSTTISFSLPASANTTLKVYNMLGNEVATLVNGQMQAGVHHVTLNVNDLPSGIYYYTLQQNNFTATKKCVVLK